MASPEVFFYYYLFSLSLNKDALQKSVKRSDLRRAVCWNERVEGMETMFMDMLIRSTESGKGMRNSFPDYSKEMNLFFLI